MTVTETLDPAAAENDFLLARIEATTSEIDSHKAAIDRLMGERQALFLAARANGITLKAIAVAARITEMAVSLAVRTARK